MDHRCRPRRRHPGPPAVFGAQQADGFLLTTALGIGGAFATFIGQAVGWHRPDQGAGFIAATLGAIVVLFIWSRTSEGVTATR